MAITKIWTRQKKDLTSGQPTPRTKQIFIRNKTHHPENPYMQNADYSADELKKSIEEMIALIKHLQTSQQLQPTQTIATTA